MKPVRLSRLLILAFWFAVLVMGIFFVLEHVQRSEKRELLSRRMFVPDTVQQLMLYFADVPDTMAFAGEDILVSDPFLRATLREHYYRLLLSTADFVLLQQRSYRWRSWVEDALRRASLPKDFFYAAASLSRLEMAMGSRAGLWALDTATAIAYGLRVDEEIDDRMNIFRSTEAVASQLSDLRASTGHWIDALRAYCQGKQGCFIETLLLSQLLASPERYGYSIPLRHRSQPLRYSLFRIQEPRLSAFAWANRHKIDTTTFLFYNPAIRYLCTLLPLNYQLYLPVGTDSIFFQ